jgi:hypothetical protein
MNLTEKDYRWMGGILSGAGVLAFVGWIIWTSINPTVATTSPVFTDGDLSLPNDAGPHPVDTRPVTVLADCPNDAGVKLSASPKFASLSGTVVDPLVFATGVSGTYTVPRGYVVGLSAIASANPDGGLDSGGVGATVTITPTGPGITGSPVTQPPILIPAGYNWSVGRPVIQGSANEMGTGTVIVFYGTQTYTIIMSLGGS